MNYNKLFFSELRTVFEPITKIKEDYQRVIDINTSVFHDLREALNPLTSQLQAIQPVMPNICSSVFKSSEVFNKLSIIPVIDFTDALNPLTEQMTKLSLACNSSSFALQNMQIGINAMKPLSDVTINLSEGLSEVAKVCGSLQKGICNILKEDMVNILKMLALFHTNIAALQIQSSFDFQFNSSTPYNARTEIDTIQSQAPPGVMEIAIENFSFNMQRCKNSKIVAFIKCKGPNFAKELFVDILKHLMLKLLGM